jgi:hypothetical protein
MRRSGVAQQVQGIPGSAALSNLIILRLPLEKPVLAHSHLCLHRILQVSDFQPLNSNWILH